MKRLFPLFFFCLLAMIASCSHFPDPSSKKPLNIGYLLYQENPSAEDSAALAWLEGTEGMAPRGIRLTDRNEDVERVDVFWLHIPDSASYASWQGQPEHMPVFQFLAGKGRGMLLTGFAALVPHASGMETEEPEIETVQVRDDWLFDQRGLQSFRGHPVFDGLFGGAFIWDACEDHRLTRIGFFGNRFPKEGRVIGVEKSTITIHPDRRLMIEYDLPGAKAVAIGGEILFSFRNNAGARMRKLVQNTLKVLGGRGALIRATRWESLDLTPVRLDVSSDFMRPSLNRTLGTLPESGLLIQGEAGTGSVELAGRRILAMGREKGGLDEVWVHPFRLLEDFRAGLALGDSVAWFGHMPCRIEIRPESILRRYETPAGPVCERIFPSLEKGGLVVHYRGPEKDVEIVVSLRCDLRWMWPYDAYALGGLHYGYDAPLQALHVRDKTGDFACIFGADAVPVTHLEGPFPEIAWHDGRLYGVDAGSNGISHAAVFRLDARNGHCVNYIISGTDQGASLALGEFESLRRDPQAVYAGMSGHYSDLLERCVTIESTDSAFNALWKWALVGTDRFLTHTPELGTALTAGFSTTARGWDGNQAVSGRPGYAWYFGRDAAWSGFALDDYGDFESVRNQLSFFQEYQDISGKIFHELTTSGVVHYDAADATPLYVILAAHYLRASGDLGFIRRSWPCIRKAMEFMLSTDTDGDGLIENTGVGHGWVEGGSLFGAHTTFYLAGTWVRALRDAVMMASRLHFQEEAETYRTALKKAEDRFGTFWNASAGFYNYGLLADGSMNTEKTVLPAVCLWLAHPEEEKALPVLREYAGNGFSSDWGMRILSSASPLFNPRGYHYGSVWPLFTGWTALAEYEYGRPLQGFTHLWNTMAIKNHWARGFVEEVMNGEVYLPSGVCPHQCWSETALLHPGITGMVGWKPDLYSGTALKPLFPLHWNRVMVRNLRAGKSVLDFGMERGNGKTMYTLTLKTGPALRLVLFPEILDGMKIDTVRINGTPGSSGQTSGPHVSEIPLTMTSAGTVEVEISHHGGVGAVPLMPCPAPGRRSGGFRILDAALEGNLYSVTLEGRSGAMEEFRIRTFGREIVAVQGGTLVSADGSMATVKADFPKFSRPFGVKKVEVVFQDAD